MSPRDNTAGQPLTLCAAEPGEIPKHFSGVKPQHQNKQANKQTKITQLLMTLISKQEQCRFGN